MLQAKREKRMLERKVVSFLTVLGGILLLVACRPKTVEKFSSPLSPVQSPCPTYPTCVPCPTHIPRDIELPPTITPIPSATPTPTPPFEIPQIPFSSSRVWIIDTQPESLNNWKMYTNTEFGFSFSYPAYLSETYYDFGNGEDRIVTLQDESTITPGSDAYFDRITVFIQDMHGKSFEDHMREQQKTPRIIEMEEGYLNPNSRELYETIVIIGGKKGVLLKGYDFWGTAERIYLPLTDDQHVLYIDKMEMTSGHLDPWFDQILSTFAFLNEH
jgi:hypothetical protein